MARFPDAARLNEPVWFEYSVKDEMRTRPLTVTFFVAFLPFEAVAVSVAVPLPTPSMAKYGSPLWVGVITLTTPGRLLVTSVRVRLPLLVEISTGCL